MVVSSDQGLRIRVPEDLKRSWLSLCEAKKISQQDAATSLLAWIVSQDDLVQSMVLGQVQPSADLVTLVLNRMVAVDGEGRMQRETHQLKFPKPPKGDGKR